MNSDQATTDDLDAESMAALRLSLVPHVGPRVFADLIEHFRSAQAVLQAAPSQLRQTPGVGPTLANAIARARETIDVQAELDHCRSRDISIIPRGHSEYPRQLETIPDPPPILFVRGDLLAHDMLSIAIVGTRHATAYGKRQAARLAASLARAGLTIVSGLARGIDSAAHRGALDAGGRTHAVLPAGLDNVYPSENKELAFDISRNGALISECPSTATISRGAFPRRNRIVTGLTLGVIVIEAAQRSGALLSAGHAMEQNREVMAVPGPIDSRVSRGCHQLIRDGAALVESADDVLQALGPLFQSTQSAEGDTLNHPAELQLNAQERQILQQIESVSTGGTLIDDIVTEVQLPVARVLATLSALEMRRLIVRTTGNRVARP